MVTLKRLEVGRVLWCCNAGMRGIPVFTAAFSKSRKGCKSRNSVLLPMPCFIQPKIFASAAEEWDVVTLTKQNLAGIVKRGFVSWRPGWEKSKLPSFGVRHSVTSRGRVCYQLAPYSRTFTECCGGITMKASVGQRK